MSYAAIGILSFLVLLLENHDILRSRDDAYSLPAWRTYRRFLLAVLTYYVTDILWGVLESRKLAAALFADTTAYYIAMAVGILCWSQFAVTYLEEENAFGCFLRAAGRVLAVLVALLSLVNIFVPVLFTVDEDCVYRALPLRYAMLTVQILMLLLISIYAVSAVRRRPDAAEKRIRYRALALFGLIMDLFLFAQLWYPYLPLYGIAYLLGTCLLHAFVVIDEKETFKRSLAESEKVEERNAYARLSALSGDSLCVYLVEPETGRYREFSASAEFEAFSLPKEGADFFAAAREAGRRFVYPEDLDRFLAAFTAEGVLSEIRRSGIFALTYRLAAEGKPSFVQMRAAMVEEKEGRRLVVGISDVDVQVRQEDEFARRLAQAQTQASVDALTGVKNRNAFLNAQEQLDKQIAEKQHPEFAVVILDVNDLKKVNDTAGHQAGDRYLQQACRVICEIFRHSPVFRIGGDEFAVISRGSDYGEIETLVKRVEDHNREAKAVGGAVVACGMAKYAGQTGVTPVFELADKRMYENKLRLKGGEEANQTQI